MKQNAFFIIFAGLSLKQIKRFFFLEGECPTLSALNVSFLIINHSIQSVKPWLWESIIMYAYIKHFLSVFFDLEEIFDNSNC